MSKRILVVEDQEDLRVILRDFLSASGYAVIEAVDGAFDRLPDGVRDPVAPHMHEPVGEINLISGERAKFGDAHRLAHLAKEKGG